MKHAVGIRENKVDHPQINKNFSPLKYIHFDGVIKIKITEEGTYMAIMQMKPIRSILEFSFSPSLEAENVDI